MSDDLYDAVLEELRDEPGPSEETRRRLAGRLSVSVGSSAAAVEVSDLASEVLAEMSGTGRTLGMVSTKAAVLMTALGFLGGAGAGAVAYHLIARPDDGAVVVVATPVDAGMADASVDTVDAGTESLVDAALEEAAVPTVSPAPMDEPPTQPSRRQERILIRQAQNALVRERADDALAALARHRRRFPDSVFSEEREALEIQALAAAGRNEEARRKADQFSARRPNSVFMPRIRAAVQ